MGEVTVRARFRNIVDVGDVMRGYITKEQIVVSELNCLVDTGAVMVFFPEDEADKLKLMRREQVIVSYADERKEKLTKGLGLEVMINGRVAVTDCVIGPPLCEPLIGQLVLEEMDFFVDCVKQCLIPRPESPNLPLLKLK